MLLKNNNYILTNINTSLSLYSSQVSYIFLIKNIIMKFWFIMFFALIAAVLAAPQLTDCIRDSIIRPTYGNPII